MNAMQRREYPIKDYALIGNCETAGLINPDGGTLALPRRVRGCHFRARCSIPKRAANFHSDPRATIALRAATSATRLSSRRAFVTEHGVVRRTDFSVIARERSERFNDFTSLRPFSPWAQPH